MIVSKLPVILAEKKLRVADVVRATGMSKSTLHKLYNEESSRIDFNTIDQLCEFLDVQVGDLFIYKPNNKDDEESWGSTKLKKMRRGISGRALYITFQGLKLRLGLFLKLNFSRFGHAMSSIYKSSKKGKAMLKKYFLASLFINIRIISWGQLQNQCL